MIRLFAALPLPLEAAQALSRLQSGVPGARWRPLETMHITLSFFGAVNEPVAADLDDSLRSVRMKGFDVALQGAGAFGEAHRMRSLWAGVEGSEPLERLANKCQAAARKVGLTIPSRRYRPHVTMAYLERDAASVGDWVSINTVLKIPSWTAQNFGLYSSLLSPSGSRYVLQREYSLL